MKQHQHHNTKHYIKETLTSNVSFPPTPLGNLHERDYIATDKTKRQAIEILKLFDSHIYNDESLYSSY